MHALRIFPADNQCCQSNVHNCGFFCGAPSEHTCDGIIARANLLAAISYIAVERYTFGHQSLHSHTIPLMDANGGYTHKLIGVAICCKWDDGHKHLWNSKRNSLCVFVIGYLLPNWICTHPQDVIRLGNVVRRERHYVIFAFLSGHYVIFAFL